MTEIEQWLVSLFTSNRVILLAMYGQVFFVLGLSVALQWRRESRLELARLAPLLAAFGFANSFAIWGDIFIPLQRSLLDASYIQQLEILQLLLMLIGFVLLATLGVRLNSQQRWPQHLILLMAIVGGATLVMAHLSGADSTLLRLRFEQIARPLFVFGGGMAAAWGMRRAAEQVQALALPPHIVSWLRVAGIAFGIYAIFGGLFIPLQPPSEESYLSIWGIPVALPRLLAIGTLAWSMIQALSIFRLELQRLREEQGRLRALATDRERIGRELHDGTIQAIYGAGLLLENGRALIPQQPKVAEQALSDAMRMLDQTIKDIRRYIFELSESEGQLAELLSTLINDLQEQSNLSIEYRLEGTIPRYSAEVCNHMVQIAREAISNGMKHSRGAQIIVELSRERDSLRLSVSDDGRGLPPNGGYRPGGRGMTNIKTRTNLLGGELHLTSRPGGGTTVEVVIPASDEPAAASDEQTPYDSAVAAFGPRSALPKP
ncbi:MAG: sensor histidine kinase [Anaerolineales bacterium]|nr:sensor histidine kinase [Anaerolineales bacterium]MCB9128375.1 sensor histidine kinase [Ardenticatenales bacterium]